MYDIEKAFRAVEDELMKSMIRNMKRHRLEEIDEKKEWEMWQTLQLKSLEEYKQANKKRFQSKFSRIDKEIASIISEARTQGNMEQEIKILEAIKKGFKPQRGLKSSTQTMGEFFKVNDRKLNALIEATQNDFNKAERAVLRMAEDQYRQVIFNAQVYANTGSGTYEQAVDMATKDFLSRGINCIEYANGARHTISDYADMAIRTAAKRAYLVGEGEKRKEWGITTVIVNKRGNACPKCLPFVGKVLIDDVWSGGKQSDGPYMLMSYAMSHGLYHPRCKDVHTTYFEGISTPGASYTKEELKKVENDYRKEQKQQYAKRQADRFGRLAGYSLDEENQKRYERKANQWKKSFVDGGDKDDLERVRGNVKMTNHDDDGKITYEIDGMRERSQIKVKECYSELMNEYNSPLKIVRKGAGGGGTKGDTDLMGVEIGLNTSNYTTMVHEFFHTLANTRRDKYGFSNNSDFWNEIKAVRAEYNKAITQSSKYKISAYASKDLDEFTAEAFAQYKTIMKGEKLGWEYGEDITYSRKVTDIIDKYFKKDSIEIGVNELEHEFSPRKATGGEFGVNWKEVSSPEYRKRLEKLSDNQKVVDSIEVRAKWALNNRDGLKTEELYAINLDTGGEIASVLGQQIESGVHRTGSFTKKLNAADASKERILLIHNHPQGFPPSINDINALIRNKNVSGITVGHDGSIYYYTRPKKEISEFDFNIALRHYKEYTDVTGMEKALDELQKEYGFKIQKL